MTPRRGPPRCMLDACIPSGPARPHVHASNALMVPTCMWCVCGADGSAEDGLRRRSEWRATDGLAVTWQVEHPPTQLLSWREGTTRQPRPMAPRCRPPSTRPHEIYEIHEIHQRRRRREIHLRVGRPSRSPPPPWQRQLHGGGRHRHPPPRRILPRSAARPSSATSLRWQLRRR